jgi:hypothetical protein
MAGRVDGGWTGTQKYPTPRTIMDSYVDKDRKEEEEKRAIRKDVLASPEILIVQSIMVFQVRPGRLS